MKINKYPDGTSYVRVPDYGQSNTFTFKINTYEDLWHLNQVVDAWNHRYGKKPTIVIPNLIDAQADRRFNDDESSGLKLVLKFLNGVDANFKIFHPHNPEVVEAMMDNVEIIDNGKFIYKVLDNLNNGNLGFHSLGDKGTLEESLILMSSDAGGFKPLLKLCDKINWKGETFSASKYRAHRNGKSELTQLIDRKNFGGKDILIIDDISVYGGTFKGLSNILRERNCGKLYLAVSHMTIQNLSKDPVTDYFDKVFTTNSKYNEYYYHVAGMATETPRNLNVIKIF